MRAEADKGIERVRAMRIAIHADDYTDARMGLPDASAPRWARALRDAGHEVRWVNVFGADIVRRLGDCDGLMWRHGHNARDRAVAKRLLPVVEHDLGLCVYPDQRTCSHFDDKIAQHCLFEALNIATPRTWVFWDSFDALKFARGAVYPLVLKLWSGAGSSQVRLVRNSWEARGWIERLFGPGVRNLAENTGFSIGGAIARARDAARWWLRGEMPDPGSAHELHKNYVLFQEFIPGNSHDTRITVIGNRAFGYRRMNRTGDFRASGSGRFDPDPRGVDPSVVRFAFRVAEALGAQSAAMDFLRSPDGWVMTEVSYAYVSWMVHACPGHWRLDGDSHASSLVWVEGRMWPEDAQAADFIARLEGRARHHTWRAAA